jgi:hypothetical protein
LNYSLSTGHSRRDWKTTEKMMDLLSPFELFVEKYASHFFTLRATVFLLLVSIYLYSQTFSDVCWRSRIIIFIIWLFWLTDVRLFAQRLLAILLLVHWAKKYPKQIRPLKGFYSIQNSCDSLDYHVNSTCFLFWIFFSLTNYTYCYCVTDWNYTQM